MTEFNTFHVKALNGQIMSISTPVPTSNLYIV